MIIKINTIVIVQTEININLKSVVYGFDCYRNNEIIYITNYINCINYKLYLYYNLNYKTFSNDSCNEYVSHFPRKC